VPLLALAPAAVAAYGAWRPARHKASRAVPAHVRRALDRLRIGEEFEVARRVQSSLLPARAPSSRARHRGHLRPANEVGGDYFDYFELEGGRLGVAIGDVSGKGVGAAIYMTLTKSYMVTQTPRGDTAGRRARARQRAPAPQPLARDLRDDGLRGRRRRRRAARVHARGPQPAASLRADGEGDFLNAPGLALGAAAGLGRSTRHPRRGRRLEPGDLVVLYTDGVTEAMDLRSEEYGEERLVSRCGALAPSPRRPPSRRRAASRRARLRGPRAPARRHHDVAVRCQGQ
jgi:sigma-B regulation protein RsbU (phosphoserine phosphatase)